MNMVPYIVFDFETGGLKPGWNEAIEIAGKAYDPRTLQPYPIESGGEFNSLMKPIHFDRLEQQALNVNGIKISQLEKAPDQKLVWQQFIDWVGKFGKGVFKAPIAGGKNIRNFDLKFVADLNKLHGKNSEKTVVFNGRREVELEDIIFMWFENEPEPQKHSMDALRTFFGITQDGAHSALVDTRQTGAMIMKFLRLKRELQSRRNKTGGRLIQFQGCFEGIDFTAGDH